MIVRLFFLSVVVVGPARAQQSSDCGVGSDTAYLDINSTRTTLFNTGILFNFDEYEYPKDSGTAYLNSSGLWISGYIDGEHRIVSSTFSGYEYAPGPLGENGVPVPNCREYDRIGISSVRDVLVFDELGIISEELRDWPWQLGAPVIDGDGVPGNYNLAGGDRPRIRGHQEARWVLNDDGINTRRSTSPDIPVQVDVSAYAMASSASYLDNTTVYEYSITNGSDVTFEEVYVGLFYTAWRTSDWTGADTTRNMVFRYSEDNEPGPDGLPPPALGIDLLQTPLDSTRESPLGLSTFVVGKNVNESYVGDGSFRYFLMGHNFVGEPFLDGCVNENVGNCLPNASLRPTGIMFPGDPVTRTPVSMINPLGDGGMFWDPSEFLLATGPFTLDPGETATITVAIIWARGEDFLDSISALREEDDRLQEAWNAGLFESPPPPDKPEPAVGPQPISPADGAMNQARTSNLHWSHIDGALGYILELDVSPGFSGGRKDVIGTSRVLGCSGLNRHLCSNWFRAENLAADTEYYWRARAIGSTSIGPLSDVFAFTTTSGGELHVGDVLRLSDDQPAFVELRGPGGTDPCSGVNTQDIGCIEVGGNAVIEDPNSTYDYYMSSSTSWPDNYAPHDFELRFGADEAYAINPSTKKLIRVPFTAWDIGNVGAFGVNDPSDDVQLLARIGDGGESGCEFEYGKGNTHATIFPDWENLPSIAAGYSLVDYAEFFAFAKTALDGALGSCASYDDVSQFYDYGKTAFSTSITGNPVGPNFSIGRPADGTIIRFLTTPWGTSAPLLSAPDEGATAVHQPITLYWNSVPSDEYNVQWHTAQVSTTPDFNPEDIVYEEDVKFEHILLPDLIVGSVYYWRVRSRPESRSISPWSETWHFEAGMPVDVETADEVPMETRLFQNYPNPFTESTTLTFSMVQSGPVSLRVYDMLGREISVIVEGELPAGRHQAVWSPRVASGVYFVVLKSGSDFRTIPLVHVR